MNVALCHPSVVPARGGCETYIGDLARRLARDGHTVSLFASAWDADALPASTHFYRLEAPRGPRFLRPWRFAAACAAALRVVKPDVSIGFDKTWGQDVLYPQGGLHAATAAHNLLKNPGRIARTCAWLGKQFDPAHRSYSILERKQYFGELRPTILVNSEMVRGHFERHYGVVPGTVRVLRSAIDPLRFAAEDRPKRRAEERDRWGVAPETAVALFIATNYRLKGLAPLLKALPHVPRTRDFRLAVIGNESVEPYRRLAATLGEDDRTLFLGFRKDPKDAYFAADFLAHPTFYDPCSLVVLEALACGLPVVTTRHNGAAELLDPSFGAVVDDPHDARALGGAIAAFLDPAFRAAAVPRARDAARAWTFEHHYRGLMAILNETRALKRAA
jgi:UDP-glucose:(heptosyl)LPS alpha-1,3-glucosyltransferase